MPPFFLVRTLGIVLLFWAHAATTAVASPEQHLQQQWTLGQAVSHALANNPDSEVARQRIGQAQAALEQARASLYPHLSVNGGYTRTNNPMLSFGNILNQGQFSEAIDFNKPGTTDSIFGQIMLRYQLYSGGRDQATRLAARYQLEAAAAQEQVSREQLSLEVVRAFHIILFGAHRVTLAGCAMSFFISFLVFRLDYSISKCKAQNNRQNAQNVRHKKVKLLYNIYKAQKYLKRYYIEAIIIA